MTLSARIVNVILSKYFRLALLLVLCLAVSLQAVYLDEIANMVIFRAASERLFRHQNLYEFIQYKIIWDKFFYAPPFAFFFYAFTLVPMSVAVFLWIGVGAGLFYVALQMLPVSNISKTIIFFIALSDLINSFQNLQTNAINTALMLFIFIALHHSKYVWAALCVAICLSIKIYPAATALLFLFYPNKARFIVWCAVFTLLLFYIPIVVVPKDYYFSCLQDWIKTITEDANDKFIANSPSLIGVNYTWLTRPLNHFYIQLTGLILVCIPLYKILKHQVDTVFILLYLSFIMLFVVIFNHATESPTYIIATTGAAIWFAVSKKNKLNIGLLILLVFACIIVPTDIYPTFIKKEYLIPLKIRVIPCVLIWLKLFYDLLMYKPQTVAISGI
jgi:hypothetical protein